MTLDRIVVFYNSLLISNWRVVLLEDADGHLSILYKSDGRIAHQFQEGYSPIIDPPMPYNVLGVYDASKALTLMKENSNG